MSSTINILKRNTMQLYWFLQGSHNLDLVNQTHYPTELNIIYLDLSINLKLAINFVI